MPNRTEARPAKAVLTYATGRLPLLRLFSTPLKMPPAGVLSEMAWSIRGSVKDIFFPRPEGESAFLTSSPCSLCERLGLGFLPSAPAAGLAWSHLRCIFN